MGKKRKTQRSVGLDNAEASQDPQATLGTSRMAAMPAFRLWNPGHSDADSASQWERDDQRAWSRDLDATSPAARSAIDQHVAYRVGTGLRYQSRILNAWLNLDEKEAESWQNNAESRFHMWASSPMASVEGDLNFYEMQALLARSAKISGDVFALLVRKERKNGWPFRTALQIIEADRICNENGAANTNSIYEGIERAADGEIIQIFVANHHPGRFIGQISDKKWQKIPIFGNNGRRNVICRKDMRRPGQTRGMPALSVITGILKQHTRYTEAEIEAAVNAASLAIFAEMDAQSFKDLFDNDQQSAYLAAALEARGNTVPLESGKILNTLPGERITSPTPGRPNPNFGTFVENFYTFFGMGLGMPPEVITGLYKSSYTAARAALQQLWQMIYIDRASDVSQICQPILETWLFDCVADNIISAPGFLRDPFIRYAWCGSQWTGSGPASLNPLDEARAAQLRAQFLTSESEETINYDGGDYASRHEQRRREADNRRNDGLPPLGATPSDTSSQPNLQDQNPPQLPIKQQQ